MKFYEMARLFFEPFLPLLHKKVRYDLKQLLPHRKDRPVMVLDAGGRKSPYTIGLHAAITIADLPRTDKLQKRLNLGLTEDTLKNIYHNRSNIRGVVFQDMTKCSFSSESFDGVICVEVLEHIQASEIFIAEIARVLKPGGWLYLTTPNGDYVKNKPPHYNPDHVHHYTKEELVHLLSRYFNGIKVTYGVKTGKYRMQGLKSWNFRRPFTAFISMISNVVNSFESRGLDHKFRRTAHLFSVAYKGPQ